MNGPRFCWAERFAAFMLISCAAIAAEPATGPLTPDQERQTFQFADPEITAELAAAEPDVISPVAIAWDAAGRMFVAEMSDYPNSPDKGRVKLLVDRDGDGRYGRVSIFADGLPFPNGVLPWNGGVLVTAAPDIWFLKDTDGDGVADERRKILTGFGEGNQQLRVNGLHWGLDNWIYGANGRSDGEIRWADASGANGPAISLRGRDFRFRPDTRELEAVAGRSQFGLARDDWGNRFLSWNTIAVRHDVIPDRWLGRNRFLAATESVPDIIEPGDTGQVFPLTPPPLTFNKESTSHFNALAGLTVYRGDMLGAKYRGNAFMGETLRNLVHRRVLDANGPTFVARRGEHEREFLASTDPWFHPVNFATGPDGALYVVDFYRRFVEHPDFVHPVGVRGTVRWRTGSEHGRIWRITQKTPARTRMDHSPDLSHASSADLVRQFENSNGWRRDTAQRLLIERRDAAVRSALEKTSRRSASAVAQLHALHTLAGLDLLTPEVILETLNSATPRLRERAIQLGGDLLSKETGDDAIRKKLADAIVARENDPDDRARLQLALTLGDLRDTRRHAVLARLASRDFTNRWHALAILSSLGESPARFLSELIKTDPGWLRSPTDEQARFLDQAARLVGANHTDSELAECLTLLQSRPASPSSAHLVLLAGLADGLARAGTPLHQLLRNPPASLASHVETLRKLSQSAADAALAADAKTPLRLCALRVATHARLESAPATVGRLLRPNQPAELQAAAARAFGELADEVLAANVFTNWNSHATGTRRLVIVAALRSAALTSRLLDALDQNVVSVVELDASTRQSLQKIQAASIKTRINKLLQNTAADRESVIREFQPALKLSGEPRRGAAIFARTCLACHAIQGRGTPIGPDLSGITSRPVEAVLVDILDPSRQVPPEYITYNLVTTQGESVSGLLVGETQGSVTLRRQGQPDETVLRGQIRELRAEGKSLMPDGLEQGLSHQDFADLLQFLRSPDPTLLPR